jgi:hypothetical protein
MRMHGMFAGILFGAAQRVITQGGGGSSEVHGMPILPDNVQTFVIRQ